MFGYVNVKKERLSKGESGLWQSFMCALCMSTKNQFGNAARLIVGNDVTFLSVLFHSATDADVKVTQKHCFSHPIRKQTMLETDELSDKLACANVLLAYYNAADDVADGGGSKAKTALRMLKKPFEKAKSWTTLEAVIRENCQALFELEKQGCDNIDEVCHPFSNLTAQLCRQVVGEQAEGFLTDLCYNVGKWIYLIDALDDVEKDIKNKNYNPFVCAYRLESVADAKNHLDEIKFLMYAVLNRVASCYNDLGLKKYACLTRNVVYVAMRDTTKKILEKIKGD